MALLFIYIMLFLAGLSGVIGWIVFQSRKDLKLVVRLLLMISFVVYSMMLTIGLVGIEICLTHPP